VPAKNIFHKLFSGLLSGLSTKNRIFSSRNSLATVKKGICTFPSWLYPRSKYNIVFLKILAHLSGESVRNWGGQVDGARLGLENCPPQEDEDGDSREQVQQHCGALHALQYIVPNFVYGSTVIILSYKGIFLKESV
jgi:hypothetical protein